MSHPQKGATSYELIHRYAVPLARVWRAWTVPESYGSWAWGRNAKGIEVEMDLQVGGLFTLHTPPKDAKKGESSTLACSGFYVEVEPEARLCYTQHWSASVGYNDEQDVADEFVVVTFREIDGHTEVRYAHYGIPDDRKASDQHSSAVRSTLDDLATLFSDGAL